MKHGKHKMNGHMMSDKEMDKMGYKAKSKSRSKKSKKRKNKKRR